MNATLITQASRKLGCRELLAEAVVLAVIDKSDAGETVPAIVDWLDYTLGATNPAANPEFVQWVVTNK
ncbi:hypothetical protein AB0K15_18915 [Amycolatopsis sp. NPDC049253]|uniref:hypothetical protein n=1 Tax=Amycolatopsis sp. NPDC049253 TaxID=3155274 RepID=UPI003432145D